MLAPAVSTESDMPKHIKRPPHPERNSQQLFQGRWLSEEHLSLFIYFPLLLLLPFSSLDWKGEQKGRENVEECAELECWGMVGVEAGTSLSKGGIIWHATLGIGNLGAVLDL